MTEQIAYVPIIIDIIIVVLIATQGIRAYRNGFLLTVLNIFPMLLSLLSVWFMTPTVATFLRKTPLFSALANGIAKSQAASAEGAIQFTEQAGQSLKLPEFITHALVENNNSAVHEILDASGVSEYVSRFLANICINVISAVLIFVVVYLAVKMIIHALNVVTKIPGLHALNRICGLALGVIKGVLGLWFAAMFVVFFQAVGWFSMILPVLQQTKLAYFLYEHNYLLYLILQIFT